MRSFLLFLILVATSGLAQNDSGCPDTGVPQSATLGEALKSACLSPVDASQSQANLDSQISSYATLNSSQEFVIAYYDRNLDSEALKPPLHIISFTKRSKRWQQADLFPPFASSVTMGQIPCLGAAVSINRVGGLLYLGLHLSPSAECMLVLDGKLEVHDVRYGWFVAGFSNSQVVYEHSTVHFAPAHPLVLSLYDPHEKKETQLYPSEQDSFRSDFIEKLKGLFPLDRCQGPNCASQPEQFESSRGDTAVNQRTHTFAFVAQFSPVGYIPAENVQTSELNENIVYVFRISRDSIDHTEFPQSEMKSRYGTEQLDDLLKPPTILRIFN